MLQRLPNMVQILLDLWDEIMQLAATIWWSTADWLPYANSILKLRNISVSNLIKLTRWINICSIYALFVLSCSAITGGSAGDLRLQWYSGRAGESLRYQERAGRDEGANAGRHVWNGELGQVHEYKLPSFWIH